MDCFYYRSAKTIHSKWTRHEAFRSEILSNKERLEKVTETGNALLQSKPEMAEMIGPKISELGTEFVSLEQKTEEKGERLFDSKRADIHSQVNFRFRFFKREIVLAHASFFEICHFVTNLTCWLYREKSI